MLPPYLFTNPQVWLICEGQTSAIQLRVSNNIKDIIVPSLSEILSSAKSQIKNSVAKETNLFKSAPSIIKQNVSQQFSSDVRNQIGSASRAFDIAVNNGISNISNGASRLLSGDFSGGFDQMAGTPSSLLNELGSMFGTKLSSALSLGVTSSSNGIAPGDNLAGMQARSDPLLGINWYAEMPVITDVYSRRSEMPWYYVEEANPPFRTYETTPIFREGKMRNYPGKSSIDSLRLGFYTDIDNVTMEYVDRWSNAIVPQTTKTTRAYERGMYGSAQGNMTGTKSGYKQDINIYLTAPNSRWVVRLTYVGCWPVSTDSYTLESNGSTRIITSVSFSVDDLIIARRAGVIETRDVR